MNNNKFLFGFVNVLLVATTIFSAIIIFQMSKNGYVSIFDMSVFRVVTGSMEPTIPVNAMLISKETDIESIQLSDIVCFESQEEYLQGIIITHRVIDILQDEQGEIVLRTKGDANSVEDSYLVSEDNLVGKVVWHTNSEGTMTSIISVITSANGFVSFIVLPCMFISTIIMRDSMKSIKKELIELDNIKKQEQDDELKSAEDYYKKMEQRIRAELEEELRNSAAKQTIERDSQKNI
ncbi:MAG: signal peptidase I [Clostridia bacterium]